MKSIFGLLSACDNAGGHFLHSLLSLPAFLLRFSPFPRYQPPGWVGKGNAIQQCQFKHPSPYSSPLVCIAL